MDSCKGRWRLYVLATILMTVVGCAGGPSRDQVQRAQREYELGVGLWQERNNAGAFEHTLRAIEMDPDNAEAHFFLGNLFMMNRHDYDRAERHFRTALEAHESAPTRSGLGADVRNSLGVLYIHSGRLDEAIEVLRESASDLMNRQPAIAWANLGWAYNENRQPDEAIAVLRQSVQLSPHLCLAWYRLAEVRQGQDDLSDAEEALSRALEVEDDTCQRLQVAWRLRGEVRARLGHRDEAVSDLERCVELSSETPDGLACRRLLEGS